MTRKPLTRPYRHCATLPSVVKRWAATISTGSRTFSSSGALSAMSRCLMPRSPRAWSINSMCGIAGIVGDSSVLMRGMQDMLHALRHRGPDGEGMELDSHAILGHRRLSIIDLEGGRQPLFNADKSILLVCNGEIYNYKELRADLEAR